MKSSFKKLPRSKIELEVVLDNKEFRNYWDNAYNSALAEIEINGFRKGTVPKDLAEKFIDKERIFNEAASEAVRYSLDRICQENNWTIIDKPKIEVDEYKMGLKYKTTLTIFPQIKLGNYKKIAKRIFSEKTEVSVAPEETEKALDWLRQSRKKDGQVPELNDEFAKSLGHFNDVEELKQSVSQGLKLEKEYRERDKKRIRALEEIIKDSEIDIPQIMVEKTLDQMLSATGNSLSEEEQKKQREQLRDKAENNVVYNLVLYKIAEIEKIAFDPQKGLNNEKVFQYLEGLANK